jgi:hypothetical protein
MGGQAGWHHRGNGRLRRNGRYDLLAFVTPLTIQPRQLKAIAALVSGKTKAKAAAAAKVSTMTLHRWLRDPAFQTAYAEAVRRVFGENIDRLKAVAGKAVGTLHRCLTASRDSDKIRAADRLLTHALRAAELGDLTERLEALEKALEAKEGLP